VAQRTILPEEIRNAMKEKDEWLKFSTRVGVAPFFIPDLATLIHNHKQKDINYILQRR